MNFKKISEYRNLIDKLTKRAVATDSKRESRRLTSQISELIDEAKMRMRQENLDLGYTCPIIHVEYSKDVDYDPMNDEEYMDDLIGLYLEGNDDTMQEVVNEAAEANAEYQDFDFSECDITLEFPK